MSKGFLKISILEVDSQYYKDREFTIQLRAEEANFSTKIEKC